MWIAFKNYYLRDTTQQLPLLWMQEARCELLSKIIIFVTRHNSKVVTKDCWLVVNCFQKLLSSWHDTTYITPTTAKILLWIAFKNYYLRDTTQPDIEKALPNFCCELLSKIIIFVTRHNKNNGYHYIIDVVNCFQKLLSSWHDTTNNNTDITILTLWIAFKNYYLRDTTQQP